jgi:hypothetical protein
VDNSKNDFGRAEVPSNPKETDNVGRGEGTFALNHHLHASSQNSVSNLGVHKIIVIVDML